MRSLFHTRKVPFHSFKPHRFMGSFSLLGRGTPLPQRAAWSLTEMLQICSHGAVWRCLPWSRWGRKQSSTGMAGSAQPGTFFSKTGINQSQIQLSKGELPERRSWRTRWLGTGSERPWCVQKSAIPSAWEPLKGVNAATWQDDAGIFTIREALLQRGRRGNRRQPRCPGHM